MDSRIKLLLLDFDGTLADTRLANARAYVATLREAGYALTEEEYLAHYFGMRCNEFLTRFGISDPAERERLRLRKIALYPTFFDSVRLNRPLWDFCRAFRAQGGHVWIVSTGSRDNIDNAMRHLGIGGPDTQACGTTGLPDRTNASPTTPAESPVSEIASPVENSDGQPIIPCPHGSLSAPADGPGNASGRLLAPPATHGSLSAHGIFAPANGSVDGILAGPDVTHSKPAPDCFLEAMRREGVTPRETLIFEDSAIGLEAARRSGASYIQVTL